MATLSAFLHPEAPENQEVYISDRFKDESGKAVPFVIRPVTEEESAALRRKVTTVRKERGQTSRHFDADRYARLFVIAGTVTPDFRASDLCDAYGVVDPELVPGKMLLAGEFAKLSEAISDISGITEDAVNAVQAAAKN